jgi:hypothetical protein
MRARAEIMTYCVEGCIKATTLGLATPAPLTTFAGLRASSVGPALEYQGTMKLRTYAEACDELGGVPWRHFDETERWFVPTTDTPSAVVIIGRPSLFSALRGVPRTTWLIVSAAAALLGFAAVLLG